MKTSEANFPSSQHYNKLLSLLTWQWVELMLMSQQGQPPEVKLRVFVDTLVVLICVQLIPWTLAMFLFASAEQNPQSSLAYRLCGKKTESRNKTCQLFF